MNVPCNLFHVQFFRINMSLEDEHSLQLNHLGAINLKSTACDFLVSTHNHYSEVIGSLWCSRGLKDWLEIGFCL